MCERFADVHAVDDQLRARAGVRVDEHADRVAAEFGGQHARRRTDPGRETEGSHPRTGADVAAREVAARGRVEHRHHVFGVDGAGLNVVDPLVVALRDDRERNVFADADVRMLADQPRHDAVVGAPDVEGVGQHDRHFEKTRQVDPVRAGQLAVAVEVEGRRRQPIVPNVGVGHDRGGARPHCRAHDFRDVRDPDAGHVGDAVERTGCEVPHRHRGTRLRGGSDARDDRNRYRSPQTMVSH